MSIESGNRLSHYRLLEKIGEGGMGVVWKAEDTILGRTVAIKVLPASTSQDEKRRKMFLDEAKLASSVSTAHIVQVYEFGREGDLDFIVMEHVEGKPLNKVLVGRPLPPEKVAEIGLQTAQALSKAHRKGLLHRDLKPANILVTPDGDVKVVDFGLATLFSTEDPDSGTAVLTRSMIAGRKIERESPEQRSISGTVPYMSPEQVRGEKMDPRTDIFSLGAVLYEMTTGQRPFQGNSNAEVAAEIQKGNSRPIHELVPRVPLDLNRIVEKSLANRPAERYQTMDDLAVDLKRLGRDLESGSSPLFEDLGKPLPAASRSRRGWIAAAGIVLLAGAAIGAWVAGKFGGPPIDPGSILVLPMKVRGQTEGAEYVGQAFAEAIAVNLAQFKGIHVLPVPETALRPDRPGTDPGATARQAGAGRLLTGALTRDGDNVQASLSLLDTQANRILWGTQVEEKEGNLTALAASLAGQVAEILGAASPRLYDSTANLTGGPEMAASTDLSRALGALKRNQIEASLEATRDLIEQFPDELDAQALRAKALYFHWQQDFSPANLTTLEKSLTTLKRIDPENPYFALFQAGITLAASKKPEQGPQSQLTSGPFHEARDPVRSIEMLDRLLEREDLTPAARVEFLQFRSWPARIIGDMKGAITDLEEALRLDPINAPVLSDLGVFYHEAGRQREAVARTRQAVALEPFNWYFYHQLGRALKGENDLQGAADAESRACELGRSQQP
ncbi:MAG: protein kinase [Acidobacteria bacterium]|nr:protein kinase [Acidobacteriota bacterium]